jgi:hypothetical protein
MVFAPSLRFLGIGTFTFAKKPQVMQLQTESGAIMMVATPL